MEPLNISSCLQQSAKLLGKCDQVFATAATPEAVTDGVDMVLQGNNLVFDCEGLNNALATSHREVLVLGAALASTLVFVMNGILSEAGLDLLAGAVAEVQLLEKPLPTRLVLVVNKCTLDYAEDALEKALTSPTSGRQDACDAIKRAFPQRHFVAIPFDRSRGTNYSQAVQTLMAALGTETLHGVFDGAALAGIIGDVTGPLTRGCADILSIHQQILGGFLKRQVGAMVQGFEENVPIPLEYNPDFTVDITPNLDRYDGLVQPLRVSSDLATQFREELRSKLNVIAEDRDLKCIQ